MTETEVSPEAVSDPGPDRSPGRPDECWKKGSVIAVGDGVTVRAVQVPNPR